MTITLILVLTIVCLCLILFACANSGIQKNKKIKKLEEQIETQKANVLSLIDHIEQLNNILCDKDTTSQKIQKAETDEEVQDIINDIIAINNSKL